MLKTHYQMKYDWKGKPACVSRKSEVRRESCSIYTLYLVSRLWKNVTCKQCLKLKAQHSRPVKSEENPFEQF